MKKILASIIMIAMLVCVMCVVTSAADAMTPPEGQAPKEESKLFINGTALAIIGAALAALLPGIGSASGVSLVGQGANGLLTENPTMFGKALALEALPMTQGIYGLVAAFLIFNNIGLFSGSLSYESMTVAEGMYYLISALPIAVVGLVSALYQAKSAASGINLLAKRPEKLGQAITSAALVETYAIFALLVTLLAIANAPALAAAV